MRFLVAEHTGLIVEIDLTRIGLVSRPLPFGSDPARSAPLWVSATRVPNKSAALSGHSHLRGVSRLGSIDHTISSSSCKFWHRLRALAVLGATAPIRPQRTVSVPSGVGLTWGDAGSELEAVSELHFRASVKRSLVWQA
jgi:hypothetical protein